MQLINKVFKLFLHFFVILKSVLITMNSDVKVDSKYGKNDAINDHEARI